MSFVWINGQLVDKSEAKISVFDHGFLYGDGVWEHFRAFNGKLFHPECGFTTFVGHFASLETLPFTEAELTAAVESTLEANNRLEGYVRVIVTRGVGTLGPDQRKLDPQVIIIAEEYRPFPEELYECGLHIVSYRFDLPHPGFVQTRGLNQWYTVEAKRHAIKNGCLDAILTDGDGRISLCTEGDLYLVRRSFLERGGTVSDIAFSREATSEFHRSLGLPILTSDLRLDQVLDADEVFLGGMSCGVIGIVQLDGKPIGTGREGPITKRIREAYRRLTRGEA